MSQKHARGAQPNSHQVLSILARPKLHYLPQNCVISRISPQISTSQPLHFIRPPESYPTVHMKPRNSEDSHINWGFLSVAPLCHYVPALPLNSVPFVASAPKLRTSIQRDGSSLLGLCLPALLLEKKWPIFKQSMRRPPSRASSYLETAASGWRLFITASVVFCIL